MRTVVSPGDVLEGVQENKEEVEREDGSVEG